MRISKHFLILAAPTVIAAMKKADPAKMVLDISAGAPARASSSLGKLAADLAVAGNDAVDKVIAAGSTDKTTLLVAGRETVPLDMVKPHHCARLADLAKSFEDCGSET